MADREASENDGDGRAWVALARRGEFDAAWRISDGVLRRHALSPDYTRPRHCQSIWTGEPLDGKRVLIRCYHGLGDTIQFIRYVPLVRARAREVIVWAQPSLIPLIRDIPGVNRVMSLHDGTPDVDYDVDVEVMELAHVFRTTLETIPANVPYLHVLTAELPGGPPRVGIVWRAGDWETRRSLPFDVVAPLFDVEGITWCSLQQHRRPEETHPRLIDIVGGSLYEDARRVKAMDLLITIDSMPAHLAGALGVPVWTLLMKDADWRWLETREDTPWYPTMALIRQEREGDWSDVIARVSARVRQGGARSG